MIHVYAPVYKGLWLRQVTAKDTGIELLLRQRGINVIHGGTNALRFTPNFDITKAEADMQIAHVREVLLEKQAEIADS